MRTRGAVAPLVDFKEWTKKHGRAIRELQPIINLKALEVQPLGFSHKGFKVGAAGLAYGVQGYRLPYGYNHKSMPGTKGDRVCAEDHMMKYAFFKGCTDIVSFSIAAFGQLDDHTGGDLNGCLIPCIKCRRMIQDSIDMDDLIKRETVFTSQLLEWRGGSVVVAKKESCSIQELLEDFPADLP